VLRQRLISGSLLALALIGLLLLDAYLSSLRAPIDRVDFTAALRGWLLNGALATLIALAFTTLATRELLRFARATGHGEPFPIVAYIFSAGLVVGPYVSYNTLPGSVLHDQAWGTFWMALALGLAFYLQTYYRRSAQAMANLAITMFIIFYAGGLGGFLVKLRMEIGGPAGVVIVLFSLLIVKLTDVGAFFVGSAFGRNKLIPWLSPKKTWEGLAGGTATAVATAMLVGWGLSSAGFVHLPQGWAYPVTLALFGVLMAAAGTAGDLFASLLKRDAAVKDSGGSIPGMGGILDVLDSPLVAAPVAWFFWTRIAPQAAA
jgi:phosphatidate cytidylyltransferase